MARFLVIALGAFLLPAALYYAWRVFAPERLGGSPAMARGEWRSMPWRWLLSLGLVLLAAIFVAMVSVSDPPAPPTGAQSGDAAPAAGN
jgi:peptidoglycan/LPS O-acetylase OafA/YrhL